MIKKYEAWRGWHSTIQIVLVEKETAASVWINGRRRAKRASCGCYFDTWQEAHDFLRESAEKDLEVAKRRLDGVRSKLETVNQLKPIT